MKKLLLLTLGTGFFAASCGTKEPQVSSNNSDSATVDTTMQSAPAVADTMSTMPADTMKVDTARATPATR